MEFLVEYGMFLAKAITIIASRPHVSEQLGITTIKAPGPHVSEQTD